MADSAEAKGLLEEHSQAGNKVRELKAAGEDIGDALAALKAVKAKYKVRIITRRWRQGAVACYTLVQGGWLVAGVALHGSSAGCRADAACRLRRQGNC